MRGIAEWVIAEKRQNRVNGFMVRDLITNEEYWRPQRRGDGSETEPDCEEESDHVLSEPQLTMDGDNNCVIKATCTLCGAKATSEPIMLLVKWRIRWG